MASLIACARLSPASCRCSLVRASSSSELGLPRAADRVKARVTMLPAAELRNPNSMLMRMLPFQRRGMVRILPRPLPLVNPGTTTPNGGDLAPSNKDPSSRVVEFVFMYRVSNKPHLCVLSSGWWKDAVKRLIQNMMRENETRNTNKEGGGSPTDGTRKQSSSGAVVQCHHQHEIGQGPCRCAFMAPFVTFIIMLLFQHTRW